MIGPYRIIISHGVGRSYLRSQRFDKVTAACGYAKDLAKAMNASKTPRAPKVRVTVLRVIEVYDGES